MKFDEFAEKYLVCASPDPEDFENEYDIRMCKAVNRRKPGNVVLRIEKDSGMMWEASEMCNIPAFLLFIKHKSNTSRMYTFFAVENEHFFDGCNEATTLSYDELKEELVCFFGETHQNVLSFKQCRKHYHSLHFLMVCDDSFCISHDISNFRRKTGLCFW